MQLLLTTMSQITPIYLSSINDYWDYLRSNCKCKQLDQEVNISRSGFLYRSSCLDMYQAYTVQKPSPYLVLTEQSQPTTYMVDGNRINTTKSWNSKWNTKTRLGKRCRRNHTAFRYMISACRRMDKGNRTRSVALLSSCNPWPCHIVLKPWHLQTRMIKLNDNNLHDLPSKLFQTKYVIYMPYIDGLVQDCSNPIAYALELLQTCAKPSI